MIKTFGDLHKLRLLNFDSGDARENKVFEREMAKPGYNTQNFKNLKCSTNGLIGKCSKWVKSRSSSETAITDGKIKSRISSVFKKQSNQSKRPTTMRSVSLYSLKQNFSSTSCLVTNPIKKTLKNINEKSLKRKQDKHNYYNKTDVRVLFMSETRKGERRSKKQNINEDMKKLDFINNSKSPNLFKFKSKQKKNQSHKNDNRMFRYIYHKNQDVCKSKQCTEHSTDPARLKDSATNLKWKPYGNTMHYNVVDFSCAACKIDSPYNECIHKISTIDTCPCVNKQVWVTTPCLDVRRNGTGDSDNNSGSVSTPNCKIHNTERAVNVKKSEDEKYCKTCHSKLQIRLPLFPPTWTKSPKSLAKVTLKYFLFVIAVIVWSPCVLLMCIYWIVTYPVRPLNILEKTNMFTGNMCGFYRKCGRNCCQSILNLVGRVSEKVIYFYNAIYSMIKNRKRQKSQCLKPCISTRSTNKKSTKNIQKLCPNPKNKYTLYYTRHRGWIMKPLKKHRRSVNKRCGCDIYEFLKDSQKKEMHDKDCDCFLENLKDNIESKTNKSLSTQLSKKLTIKKKSDHSKLPKTVSQKTSPDSNICCLPPKICCKDAATLPPPVSTDTQVPPDLISDKDSCHQPIRNRSLQQDPRNSIKNVLKSRKNVSFDGKIPDAMDLSDPRNAQVMSPRVKLQSPFHQDTATRHDDCFPQESSDNIIQGKPICPYQNVRRVPTDIRFKTPIRSKERSICTKYPKTEIFQKPSEGNTPECMDQRDPRNAQVMSPRLNLRTPFHLSTLPEDSIPREPIDKIIKGRSPCPCQNVRRVPTHITFKRPIPCKEKKSDEKNFPKYSAAQIYQKPSRLDIKPKFLYRKYEGKPKKLTRRQKVCCWCKSARKNVRDVVHDVECEVWKCNYCKDLYIHTLRRTPWFWVYKRWPAFYPYFLIFYRFYENVVIGLLFIISSCVWVPILCWCYFCFSLFCRGLRC